MAFGGLQFEQQRFNLRSAGVSSSLLFVSVAGAYVPNLSLLVCAQFSFGHVHTSLLASIHPVTIETANDSSR